jgi:25S rRNA (uracil2634-N3)-methyltransferase
LYSFIMGKRERQRQKIQKKVKAQKSSTKSHGGRGNVHSALHAPVPGSVVDKILRPGGAKKEPAPRRVTRYDADPNQSVLVLGDGDFSFGLGLFKHRGSRPHGLTVTSYDSKAATLEKYSDTFPAILGKLEGGKVPVYHHVDATRIEETLRAAGYAGDLKWDRIVWNFPHTGQQKAHVNRAVLADFLRGARSLLAHKGQVHVTIKLAPPYDRWGLDDEAGAVSGGTGMAVGDETPFDASLFPGYHHQTTLADAKQLFAGKKVQKEAKCRTYCFVPVKAKASGAP